MTLLPPVSLLQVDAVVRAAKAQRNAAVHQAFRMHARPRPLVEQVGRALLEHARAYAAQHIVLAALLDHDGV
jgi:hypothetical protein